MSKVLSPKATSKLQKEAILYSLYGVIIGDALGAPVEMLSRDQIFATYGSPIIDYETGGVWNVSKGQTTDDTATTLAVCEGIIRSPNIDNIAEYIGQMLIHWFKTKPQDIGPSTQYALELKEKEPGKPWAEIGQATYKQMKSNTNGSLMRNAYCGLYYNSSADAIKASQIQSSMTHLCSDCLEACETHAMILNYLTSSTFLSRAATVVDKKKGLTDLLSTSKNFSYSKFTQTAAFKNGLPPQQNNSAITSLQCALWSVFKTDSFEKCLISAVNIGGDTDTIASIAGSIAGAIYGNSLPDKWFKWIDKQIITKINNYASAASKNRSEE